MHTSPRFTCSIVRPAFFAVMNTMSISRGAPSTSGWWIGSPDTTPGTIHGTIRFRTDWAWVDTTIDVYEDVTVSESVSEAEISSEESYAETESFEMSDAEEEEVAAEEDTDEEVASADDDSMGDASDDEGEDMNDDDGGGAPGD